LKYLYKKNNNNKKYI